MPGNCVGEPRAQHNELVLALVFGCAAGAADGVVKAAQLALGARVHVAHAAHHGVCLVIQIEAIADQFVEIDFGWTFGTAIIAPVSAAIVTPVIAASTAFSGPAVSAFTGTSIPAFSTFSGWPRFFGAIFDVLCHATPRSTVRPTEGPLVRKGAI